MSSFLDFLIGYVQKEFSEAANSNDTSEFRACFKGPPTRVLDSLYTALSTGRQLDIAGNARLIHIPVFYLDPNAQDPSNIQSARCTRSYLVNVRTSECKHFLALLPPDDDLTLSSSSTLKHLGASADESLDLSEQPLGRSAITEALQDCFNSEQIDERAHELVRLAMAQAKVLDQAGAESSHQWMLLERLFEYRGQLTGWARLLASAGMPAPYPDGSSSPKDYEKALTRLALELENRGFGEAIANLSNATDDVAVKDALVAAIDHIRSQCLVPSRFSEAPSCFYFPFSTDEPTKLPTWWSVLRVDVLQQLFDVTDPAPAALQASCIGPLIEPGLGLPYVVQSAPTVQVRFPDDESPRRVLIYRGKTVRNREFVAELDPDITGEPWTDPGPIPTANGPIRYWLSADGLEEASLRVIVLDSFEPGLLLHTKTAEALQAFRRIKKKKGTTSGTQGTEWECEIHLNGVGTHQLEIYASSNFSPSAEAIGVDVDSEQDAEAIRPINPSGEHHWVCLIETDEECSYKFSARDAQGSVHSYTTLIRGNENTPVDVESEFDRLVIENRNRSSGKPSGTRTESPNNRLKDLQRWMIEDDNSFAPTWLGSDFRDAWRKPNWPASAALSSRLTLLDVRPILSEFNPPQELLATRKGVLQTLRTFDGGSTSCVEDVRLGELMRDATFCGLVETYVRQFTDWLVQDYERAAWMDTIAVSFPDDSGLALNPYPVALILSPLHPLRLGWQCNAQKMLTDALDASMPCPAASVLDPSTFPDCMELPCRSASGQISHRKYISVRSTSDYWTVLWAQDEVSKCSSDVARATFGADLGLRVEGLSPGFTVSQVTRSLNEVTSIFPARSTLKVAILSDTKEASPINDGIAEWCEDSLGPVEDLWFNAGPKKLEVIDTRGPSEQPDEAYLASTCRRTGDSLNWYTAKIDDAIKQCDLAVIAHLSTSPPEFQTHEMRSILDPHAVYRQRIRKLVGSLENRFIAESRIGKFDMTSADIGLPSALLECVCHLESSCTPSFDSHVTAPRLTTLDRALSIAEYCALTAANVDPACFLGNAGPTYLWDYELPSYSRRAGHNEGYYLLAGASPRMARAVSNASAVLAGNEAGLENSAISQLLAESSRRGVPTLKRLTSGGSASLGEIGTLIALRVIQPELCDDLLGPSLFSVLSKDNLINLLVPVDPFIEHIRTLRTALGTPSSERPDLLAFSVSHQNGIPDGIRITPIEVKARYGALAHGQRKLALAQASDFSNFLVALKNRASQSTLWRVAWVHFLGSFIQYAFRVYGQSEGLKAPAQWTKIHANSLEAIANGNVAIDIDTRGRLILLDSSTSTNRLDIDADGFHETIVIARAEARAALLAARSETRDQLIAELGSWDLQRESPTIVVPPLPPEPAVEHDPDPRKTTPITPINIPDPMQHPNGVIFPIGRSIDAIAKKEFVFQPSNTALSQLNVGIVGNLGTGKTQLIQALLYRLARSAPANRGTAPRVLIFDYKKDYSKPEFVAATGAKVIEPFRIPLNLFDVRDCSSVVPPWLQRARFFIDVLSKIYSGIGPVQKVRLKEAVKRGYEAANAAGQDAPTIGSVFQAYAEEVGDDYDTPYSIMSDLVDQELFVSSHESTVPFSEFLNGVVVVDLGALGQDDNAKNMLVAIFLNLFYEHMLKVKKREFLGTDPQTRFLDSFILVDEADNIMKYEFDVLSKILLQGREFGTGVILASQYLSHFTTRNKNYLEPLLSWFVHQVPNVTARELEGIGLTRVGSEIIDRVKTLQVHECFYKSLGVDGRFVRGIPFYELRKNDSE